jgi:hypothetical protein
MPDPLLKVGTTSQLPGAAARKQAGRRSPGQGRTSSAAGVVRADERIRTADPFITSEVLYQLSYVGEVPEV